MASSVLTGLPQAILDIAEAAGLADLQGEARANCAQCPMVGADPLAPAAWEFRSDVRCCGFHPQLANFLVGRALEDGGIGAERVRARIALQDGVSPWGIYPPAAVHDEYARAGHRVFGADRTQRCPYAIDGDHLCSIWKHRPGVCRTWYCKHDAGEAGALGWNRVEQLLWHLENRLAFLLVELGDVNQREEVPPESWSSDDYEAWFSSCADRIDALSAAEVEQAMGGDVARALQAITSPPIPTLIPPSSLVRPSVGQLRERDGRVLVAGYSHYDAVLAPRSVFALLAALDGETPWRDVLAGDAWDTDGIDADTVRSLCRVGALSDVRPDDDV